MCYNYIKRNKKVYNEDKNGNYLDGVWNCT